MKVRNWSLRTETWGKEVRPFWLALTEGHWGQGWTTFQSAFPWQLWWVGHIIFVKLPFQWFLWGKKTQETNFRSFGSCPLCPDKQLVDTKNRGCTSWHWFWLWSSRDRWLCGPAQGLMFYCSLICIFMGNKQYWVADGRTRIGSY